MVVPYIVISFRCTWDRVRILLDFAWLAETLFDWSWRWIPRGEDTAISRVHWAGPRTHLTCNFFGSRLTSMVT